MAEKSKNVDEDLTNEETMQNVDDGVESKEATDTPNDDQIVELKEQLAAMEDKFIRSQAEIANMHTRFKKEQETLLKYEGSKLAKAVIPAVDNLERALEVQASGEAAEKLKTGVNMVLNTVVKALEENEIRSVGKVGDTFDPSIHQAIQSVTADDEHPVDTIVAVLQKGYVLKDRVLRPAMVSVAQ